MMFEELTKLKLYSKKDGMREDMGWGEWGWPRQASRANLS